MLQTNGKREGTGERLQKDRGPKTAEKIIGSNEGDQILGERRERRRGWGVWRHQKSWNSWIFWWMKMQMESLTWRSSSHCSFFRSPTRQRPRLSIFLPFWVEFALTFPFLSLLSFLALSLPFLLLCIPSVSPPHPSKNEQWFIASMGKDGISEAYVDIISCWHKFMSTSIMSTQKLWNLPCHAVERDLFIWRNGPSLKSPVPCKPTDRRRRVNESLQRSRQERGREIKPPVDFFSKSSKS